MTTEIIDLNVGDKVEIISHPYGLWAGRVCFIQGKTAGGLWIVVIGLTATGYFRSNQLMRTNRDLDPHMALMAKTMQSIRTKLTR